MSKLITSPLTTGVDDLVLPWETAVPLFRMHLASLMLKRGMSVIELTEKLNDFKDTALLEELFKELFAVDVDAPKMSIAIGDRSYEAAMSLNIACNEGVIIKTNLIPRAPVVTAADLTIDAVVGAIAEAYPDYTVWCDGDERVYVDEGDDDPNLMSVKDAYQKYIVDAGK
jgi:hypothetical protein